MVLSIVRLMLELSIAHRMTPSRHADNYPPRHTTLAMTPFHLTDHLPLPQVVSTPSKPRHKHLLGPKMSSDQPEDIAVQQPLLASPREENASRNNRGTFTRNLGAAEAFGIVVSIVIGSGVFTSPGSIDTNVPSPGIALAIWLIGGVLAWTGATTFAELGTAIEGEGEISLLKLG